MLRRQCPCPITSQTHFPGSLPCGGLHSSPSSHVAPLHEGSQPTVTSFLALLRPHHSPRPTGPPWPLQMLSPSHPNAFPSHSPRGLSLTHCCGCLSSACFLWGVSALGAGALFCPPHIPHRAGQVQEACS